MTDNKIFGMNRKEFIERLYCVLAGFACGIALVITGYVIVKSNMPAQEPIERERVVYVKEKAEEQPKIDRITLEYVEGKLENIGTLSTAELVYSSICKVEDGKVPILTKKGFSMIYTAKLRAGIDVSKIEVEVTESEVNVKIPKAEIDMLHVLPESIQFFDNKYALFNWTSKEDVTEAIAIAESDLSATTEIDSLIDKASSNAKEIIESILTGSVEEKTLTVSLK